MKTTVALNDFRKLKMKVLAKQSFTDEDVAWLVEGMNSHWGLGDGTGVTLAEQRAIKALCVDFAGWLKETNIRVDPELARKSQLVLTTNNKFQNWLKVEVTDGGIAVLGMVLGAPTVFAGWGASAAAVGMGVGIGSAVLLAWGIGVILVGLVLLSPLIYSALTVMRASAVVGWRTVDELWDFTAERARVPLWTSLNQVPTR